MFPWGLRDMALRLPLAALLAPKSGHVFLIQVKRGLFIWGFIRYLDNSPRYLTDNDISHKELDSARL